MAVLSCQEPTSLGRGLCVIQNGCFHFGYHGGVRHHRRGRAERGKKKALGEGQLVKRFLEGTHLHFNVIGQNFVTWLYLSTREFGKSSVLNKHTP